MRRPFFPYGGPWKSRPFPRDGSLILSRLLTAPRPLPDFCYDALVSGSCAQDRSVCLPGRGRDAEARALPRLRTG
eukprot:8593520-Pyramimonas_sp.AAC.1